IIAVFAFVVAQTFNKSGESASASIYFILLAVVFGLLLFKNILSFRSLTILGVIFLGAGVYLCNLFPVNLSLNIWMMLIFGYIFLASVLPVWILLQPRDYLSSFLLYAIMIIAFVSIIFYNPHIEFEAFTGFSNEHIGSIFPFLFVTIACGAISGFHSIVSSGTSSKQLDKESDALPVAYGSMLVESLLAVIALITAVYLAKSDYLTLLNEKGPIAIFSSGIATFGTAIGIPVVYLSTFALLAISAFALTSLDTATRLARFSWQELFDGHKLLSNKYVATSIAVIAGGGLAFSGYWKEIWPLFGAANQMLAALALLAGYLFFKANHKGHVYFLLLPMIFMYTVTLTALVFIVKNNLTGDNSSLLRAFIASVLFILAIVLLVIGVRKVLKSKKYA
ncbi:MAG: carbon starvation protein A, partial [Deltaproteobacteria bacterium]|nr:carbon starvation protein A [Deltaproteobacteria bacterium]